MYVDRTSTVMSDLAEFLAYKLKQSSYRQLEIETGVSRGALEKIINRVGKGLPEIGTLERIAKAYEKPLWEVAQLAGVDLDLPQSPTERTQRLQAIVDQVPNLERVVTRLKELRDVDPDFVDGMIISLEMTIEQRLKSPPL